MNKQCHGHYRNKICEKCLIYQPLSTKFQLSCKENQSLVEHMINSKSNLILNIKKEPKKKRIHYLFHKKDFYYDFYYGCRFKSLEHEYDVKVINVDTGNVILNVKTIPGEDYSTLQKFYVKYKIEVYYNNELFLEKELDLNNKNILIRSSSKCLGDNIAWIESIVEFQKKYNCHATYYIPYNKHVAQLLKQNYPQLEIITVKNKKKFPIHYRLRCGNIFSKYETIIYDRLISLEKIPQYILSLDNIPKIRKFKVTENIDMGGAYMCYSERASSQMKEWNNPEELKKVIKYIQSLGIKVVNIDVKPYCKNIEGVIYLNGTSYSLQDRVNIMSNSLFYMGMASGLSWLAWACHKPAVIISGFSLPIAEYDNPYRVFNTDACFGCWNYTTNYACTSFSCNKAITHKQVIKTINKLLNI